MNKSRLNYYVNETLTGAGRLTLFNFAHLGRNDFPTFRLMYSAGQLREGNAMPLNLDSKDNTAIRKEIGERLRVLLSKEQPSPSPRVQYLLDCLSALDDR